MTCDYCNKKTAFLEHLEYCSVCLDCFGEIESQDSESNKLESFLEQPINEEDKKD
jgi:hypothetical protein